MNKIGKRALTLTFRYILHRATRIIEYLSLAGHVITDAMSCTEEKQNLKAFDIDLESKLNQLKCYNG